MENLPEPLLRTKWVMADSLPDSIRVVAENELERATNAAGWNPKVIRVRRDLHILNVCAHGSKPSDKRALHSVLIALLRDHPFLAYLNTLKHVPKVVKAPYRKEVRLAHYRAGEIWPFYYAMKNAEESWDAYKSSLDVTTESL